MSTACRSANGDVKFEEHSTPFIFWDNVWSPICGHYFWDNQVGATKFCQKIMYKEGEWATSGNSYSTDAFRVGECNAEDDWDTKCTGGCNDYEAGGQCSNAWFNNGYCNKDDDVAIKIKCNQPLTANAEVANPSCSGNTNV